MIESHLSEKGREVRTIRTLLESNTSRGIGIDENVALFVNNPLSLPVGKVRNHFLFCSSIFPLYNSFFFTLQIFKKVVTALGAKSGVFYVDVSSVPFVSMTNALYENIVFSFFTVDDSFDFNLGISC